MARADAVVPSASTVARLRGCRTDAAQSSSFVLYRLSTSLLRCRRVNRCSVDISQRRNQVWTEKPVCYLERNELDKWYKISSYEIRGAEGEYSFVTTVLQQAKKECFMKLK